MASKLSLRVKPVSFSIASRRATSSRAISTCRRPTPSIAPRQSPFLPRPLLQQSFRRAYAENAVPQAQLSPNPIKPQKRFRVFRFLWRVTYLSAFAGLGYLSYTIWDGRNPNEQFDPDPHKKTLVVLGKYFR